MKVDQVLIQYLLKYRQLPLQGIGVIKLSDGFSNPDDPEKPIVIPEDAISFVYDTKTREDPELVSFISKTTGKIHPLASADLDSFITLGKQFINIGKAMNIPFIGAIERDNAGNLYLKSESRRIAKDEIPKRHVIKVDEHHEELGNGTFDEFPSRNENKGRNFLYLLILIILGLTVWAVWKYAFNSEEDETITSTHEENDTASRNSAAFSDSTKTQDAATAGSQSSARLATDTVGFGIVVGTYTTRESAQKRVSDLTNWGRNVKLYSKDSLTYHVAEVFPNRNLSDTTIVIDSLRKYYGERSFSVRDIK